MREVKTKEMKRSFKHCLEVIRNQHFFLSTHVCHTLYRGFLCRHLGFFSGQPFGESGIVIK